MTSGSILLEGGFLPGLGIDIVENPLVAMSLTRCCKTNSWPICMELEVFENMVQDLMAQQVGQKATFKNCAMGSLLKKC